MTAHLTDGQLNILAALVDTIVPPDDHPGGVAAGVLDYLAMQFDADLMDQRQRYRLGLDALDAEARAAHACPFAALEPSSREELLRAIESDEPRAGASIDLQAFLADAVGHTMEGFYGDPANGGNRNAASWEMVGFGVSD